MPISFSAVEKYWKNKDGEDIRTYSNQSEVVEKQFKVKGNKSFLSN